MIRIELQSGNVKGGWPTRSSGRRAQWLTLLFTVLLILCTLYLAACTPRPLIIQVRPVAEPVTTEPLPEPQPPGHYSRRLREILGQT